MRDKLPTAFGFMFPNSTKLRSPILDLRVTRSDSSRLAVLILTPQKCRAQGVRVFPTYSKIESTLNSHTGGHVHKINIINSRRIKLGAH